MTRFPALVAAVMLGAAPLASLASTQAEVNATLSSDQRVWSSLVALAIADEIRTHCPTIEAREFRTTTFVLGLFNHARGLGFSRQEIRAFQVHETTETRLRAEVNGYFAANGVREGAADTYCVLGLAEIAAGSQAGEFLRAR